MKLVIYYTTRATVSAAAAGLVIAGLHTWLFSYTPTRSRLIFTLVGDAVTALAIAAGQGAGALGTGGGPAQFGRAPPRTGRFGLLVGGVGFAVDFPQMAGPPTELGIGRASCRERG